MTKWGRSDRAAKPIDNEKGRCESLPFYSRVHYILSSFVAIAARTSLVLFGCLVERDLLDFLGAVFDSSALCVFVIAFRRRPHADIHIGLVDA